MNKNIFALIIFYASISIALSENCSNGQGTCVSTSVCSTKSGVSLKGLCPGAADIQCCTKIPCGSGGKCMESSNCSGTIKTGLCPGSSSFICCEGNSGSTSGTSCKLVKSNSNTPVPIAWQQSTSKGDAQRSKYLTNERSWGSYSWIGDDGGPSSISIGTSGCSILATVNVFYYGTKLFLNPIIPAQYALDKGFRRLGQSGVSEDFFRSFINSHLSQHGMKYVKQTYSASEVLQHIKNGGQCIGHVSGHYIGLAEYNESKGGYLLLDSASGTSRSDTISWTDRANGIAWVSEKTLKRDAASGTYGINGLANYLVKFN